MPATGVTSIGLALVGNARGYKTLITRRKRSLLSRPPCYAGRRSVLQADFLAVILFAVDLQGHPLAVACLLPQAFIIGDKQTLRKQAFPA